MTFGDNNPDRPGTPLPVPGQNPAAGFPAAGGPPPGWYPDPAGAPMQRFFNGTQWTDQLAPWPAPSPTIAAQPTVEPTPAGIQGAPESPPPGALEPVPAPPARSRVLRVAAGAAVAAVVFGATALGYQYKQRVDAEKGPCPVKGTHSIMLAKKNSDEPTVILPAAPGWKLMERNDLPSSEKVLDSPLIRGFVANTDLQENGFSPNAVVTMEKYTESGPLLDEKVAKAEAAQLKTISTVDGPTFRYICSNDVFQIDFTGLKAPNAEGEQTGMELVTVVNGQDGAHWVVGLTLQTRNPDHPGYKAQRDALLRGFSVEPPPLQK